MAWIEYHTALRDHWKIQRLSDSLKLPYCHALGAVSCLWLWCVENSPKGEIGRFTNDEICRAMRLESVLEVKIMLKKCELIDENGLINDWKKHGLKYLVSTRKRVKQYRERLRYRNVTVTPTNQPNQPNQPTIEDVRNYCKERGNDVDANKWHNFYSSKGWMIGKNKMKDWKAAVRTWETKHGIVKPKPPEYKTCPEDQEKVSKMIKETLSKMGAE
jgi:hypothetical protein